MNPTCARCKHVSKPPPLTKKETATFRACECDCHTAWRIVHFGVGAVAP